MTCHHQYFFQLVAVKILEAAHDGSPNQALATMEGGRLGTINGVA